MDLDIKLFIYINVLLIGTGLVQVNTASKPQMLTISGPEEVTAGMKSVFTCSAICSSTCFYTWYTETQSINGSTLSLSANGLNSFESVMCSVTTDFINYASENKYVRVINPYSAKPKLWRPTLGLPFNLTCEGTSPQVAITWLKGGEPLKFDSRMSLSSDKMLMFSVLKESDSGRYQCKVFNGGVWVVSTNFWLNFGYALLTLSGPNQAEVGLESRYTCNAKCEMDCTVHWALHSGFPKGRFIADGPMIQWTPSDVGQTQIFTCIAMNPGSGQLGQVSKKLTVVEARTQPISSDAPLAKSSLAAVSRAALVILVSFYI